MISLALILCMAIGIPTLAEGAPEPIYPLLDVSKQELDAGSMFIYDFGPIKLHMYRTGVSMGNVSYLVEGDTNLVGIEMPAFPENLEAWDQYVVSLGKPLDDVFVSIHPAGGSYLTDKHVYGTTVRPETQFSDGYFMQSIQNQVIIRFKIVKKRWLLPQISAFFLILDIAILR